MKYATTRDIVIPAGTIIGSPPRASSRWGLDYEAVVGIGKDHSGYFSIDLSEALEAGIVAPVSAVAQIVADVRGAGK